MISTRSHEPNSFMGRHVEGFWVRKDNWFLRWHKTDNELELFDLSNDLRNDHDVSADHPEKLKELKAIADNFREKRGQDPRISFYQKLTGKEK